MESTTLRTVSFSAQLLSSVQQFDCGDEPWAMAAADWIKQAPPFRGALLSMTERGNAVWLHFLDVNVEGFDESCLVGFSSLGTIRSDLLTSMDLFLAGG